MESPQTPNQPPQNQFTKIFEILNRHATPIIFTLGLLLIVGGIVLGQRQESKKNDIVSLPDYSPVITTSAPEPLAETTPSPEAAPTPSNEPSPAPSPVTSPAVVQSLPSPLPIVASIGSASTARIASQPRVAGISTSVPQTSVAQPVGSPLPIYSPLTLSGSASQPLPEYSPATINEPVASEPAEQKVIVTLAVGGRTYSAQVKRNSTVIEAMESMRGNGLNFRTQHFSGLGDQIIEVNGVAQGDGKYWIYTVNGSMATQGASSQTINETTVITWTLS